MSIATLKKKTQHNYHNNSVSQGHQGFSLNGTHRSQGWVGQELRSRTLVRTLNRGGANRGHGGCCGKYPRPFVRPSEIRSTENPNVVKSSVINTEGMIRERFAWIWRPAPYTSVKWDDNHGVNDQSSYLQFLDQRTLSCGVQKSGSDYCENGAVSQGEYLTSLDGKCYSLDTKGYFYRSHPRCTQCPIISSTIY
jgi:hypothetical protein